MLTTYLRVSFPTPELPAGAHPCSECLGEGVEQGRYEMPVDGGKVLLIDRLCTMCVGCGNAACQCGYDWSFLDDDQDDQDEPTACGSCSGRGWTIVQAWSPSDPESAEAVLLRVPCGCQESRTETVEPSEIGGAL